MTQRDDGPGSGEPVDVAEGADRVGDRAGDAEAPEASAATEGSGASTPGSDGAAAQPGQPPIDAADEPAADVQPEPPSTEELLEDAVEQHRKSREQLLRVAADFDNFRKRARRDVEEAKGRAAMATIRELLPVFDNLERATGVAETTDAAAITQGLRLVLRQFIDALKKLGVDRVDAVGVPFDPMAHESLQLVESEEHEAGLVVAVVQPGYRMGSSLVRPALVVVSKGPAQVAEPAVSDPDEASGADASDARPAEGAAESDEPPVAAGEGAPEDGPS